MLDTLRTAAARLRRADLELSEARNDLLAATRTFAAAAAERRGLTPGTRVTTGTAIFEIDGFTATERDGVWKITPLVYRISTDGVRRIGRPVYLWGEWSTLDGSHTTRDMRVTTKEAEEWFPPTRPRRSPETKKPLLIFGPTRSPSRHET